jgi:protein-S-isoprenylcysteine O-methyltransferase Ste14
VSGARRLAARAAYGALFVAALPLALVLWSRALDGVVSLPAYGTPLTGGAVALLGLGLMAWATAALWHHGGGLPMSAYPPERFVSRGPYRFLSHPIYLGAVLVAGGMALHFRSPAGLWVVTPLLALGAAAWVLGYERGVTRRHFAEGVRPPLLRRPPASDAAPTPWDRASVFALLFLPWLVLFMGIELLGVPPDAIVVWQAWELALPVVPWTEAIYALVYPLVVLLPFVAARRRHLRWLITRGWLAMAIALPLYLLLPLVVPAKPVEGSGFFETLMRWERAYDEPVTAFPSFHVIWALLAARMLAFRWPRLAPAWWTLAAAITVSCFTVGMHASVDLIGGVAVFALVDRADRAWVGIRRAAERVAGSWKEVTVGPVRLINHGSYAAAGLWLGVMVAVALAGPRNLGILLAVVACSVLGAALWGQVVEGSSQLLRPFGYYGGIFGGLAALWVAAAAGGDFWLLIAALAVGGSLTQAVGRGRCLVQGCCHGREAPAWLGIRYAHPRSRVTRLAGLGGRPLHPTQLYSAAWMLLVAAVLVRLWTVGAPLSMVAGLYLVLAGLGRFVEEAFRGEPQTASWRGFTLYQWLALGSVLGGAALSGLGGAAAPAATPVPWAAAGAVTLFSVGVYAAYGLDLPRVAVRFSRLS